MSNRDYQSSLIRFINKVSKYSLVYYITMTLALILLQMDIFNEHVPVSYVINGVITVNTFTIGTSIIDKVLKRNKTDPKPFLYCPECGDAKMTTTGTWECEKCHKTFGEPKRDEVSP